MDISDWLSIVAIVISVICLIVQFRKEKKYHSKQKMLEEIYDTIYINFPKKMDEFLKQKSVSEECVNNIKDYICDELKPVFSFIRFRNEKKYREIKQQLSRIEDVVCSLLDDDDCFMEKKKIEEEIKNFYKMLDKYFLFSR